MNERIELLTNAVARLEARTQLLQELVEMQQGALKLCFEALTGHQKAIDIMSETKESGDPEPVSRFVN